MDSTAEPLWKTNPREYWKDWYWNRGGREKVQATRYIAEYKREQLKKRNNNDTTSNEFIRLL